MTILGNNNAYTGRPADHPTSGNTVVDNIQKILNSKKIKYTVLDELFNGRLVNKDIEFREMNIFIDLQSVIRQLYKPEIMQQVSSLSERDRIMISSELINIIGHYRHYFASRKKMFTNFYYFYSFRPSNYHLNIYPEYRSDYYSKRNNLNDLVYGTLNRIISGNLKITRNIVLYIPKAYFLDTGNIEPTSVPSYIIKNSPKDHYNMILSNDDIFFQDLKYDNTMILEMRGSEKSELIDRFNVIEASLRGTKKHSSDFPNIGYDSIPIVDGMRKLPIYNTNSISRRSFSTGYSAIEKLISKGQIETLKLSDPDYILSLGDILFNKEDQIESYKNNIKLLNHDIISESTKASMDKMINSQILDLRNDKELRQVSDKFFEKFPIRLDYAFNGEENR